MLSGGESEEHGGGGSVGRGPPFTLPRHRTRKHDQTKNINVFECVDDVSVDVVHLMYHCDP